MLWSNVDPKLRRRENQSSTGHSRSSSPANPLFGPQHGHGIVRAIQQQSEDAFLVEHSSLYPALQRLEARGWICAEWGTSTNNRKARFYELTKAGRKQLVA